jgi:hypothetical protein
MNIDVLKDFAERHALKLTRDGCGDSIIPGAVGHILDGFADGKLGVYVRSQSPKGWTYARRGMEATAMTVKQDGDVDGVAVFDPANREQAQLATKVTGARIRRMAGPPSPAQIAARAAFADRQRKPLIAA